MAFIKIEIVSLKNKNILAIFNETIYKCYILTRCSIIINQFPLLY